MPALYCASCGAPAATRVVGHACSYCQSPLVPAGHPHPASALRCGQCTAANDPSARYCGRCGQELAPVGMLETADMGCAGCENTAMDRWRLLHGEVQGYVAGCSNCGGSWITHQTFDALQRHADAQFEQSNTAASGASPTAVKRRQIAGATQVQYRRCPLCREQMARTNYARASGIILDTCPAHGVYFDAGELEGVLDFVQSGGLALARRKQSRERESKPAPTPPGPISAAHVELGTLDEAILEMSWEAVCSFVHWAQDWLDKARA